MLSLRINRFRKSAHCPASQVLLAYGRAELAMTERVRVEDHLDCCEFCSAELPLLDRYHGDDEEVAFTDIPSDLRKLAEKVLRSTTVRLYYSSEVLRSRHVSN